MNDEKTKKALECCVANENCKKCPLAEDRLCFLSLKEKALALINRQQAEIERLKWEKYHFEFKVDDLNGKLEKFKEYRDIKNGAYEREIERLKSLCTSKDVIIKAQEAEIEMLQKKNDRAMDNLKAVLKEREDEQDV